MRKKGYKGRCEKKDLSKCQEVCRTYDAIQSNYADILQNDNDIQEIRCNVLLDGLSEGTYTSDFVCVKADGDLMVRECVFRKFLTKPMTVKLLDAYEDMDSQPVQGETIRASKKEIEDTLDTLNTAFAKLLDSVFQDTAWDVSSDISVLHTILAQEGLKEDGMKK